MHLLRSPKTIAFGFASARVRKMKTMKGIGLDAGRSSHNVNIDRITVRNPYGSVSPSSLACRSARVACKSEKLLNSD